MNPRLQPSESRADTNTTRRQIPSGDDAYAKAGRDAFGRVPWEVKKLAKELDISETSARDLKDGWLSAGVVAEARMGRWYFTYGEIA